MKKYLLLKKYSKGFTLMETLVAISLLSVAVLGVFTAVQGGLRETSYAKDQVIAFFMAQEGMEYIKNMRDENALNDIKVPGSRTWLSGLSAVTTDPCWYGGGGTGQKTCRIDSINKNVSDCALDAGGVCKNLQQDSASGLYGYTGGWPVTSFKRSVQFQTVAGTTDEVTVVMTITWVTRGVSHSFQVTESFFNR